jgi:hypothetical protein
MFFCMSLFGVPAYNAFSDLDNSALLIAHRGRCFHSRSTGPYDQSLRGSLKRSLADHNALKRDLIQQPRIEAISRRRMLERLGRQTQQGAVATMVPGNPIAVGQFEAYEESISRPRDKSV